ncbi:MAG: hypothetical protein KA329_09600 [Novosphingobium sp.]|nr:hypothetical protein [Novosphingobium sp.]
MSSVFDLTPQQRANYSLLGAIRFDAPAVADAIRAGSLPPFAMECLAQLIEGSRPNGVRLAIKGQGKGWKPIYEKAKAFDRLIAIGGFIDEQIAKGCSVEGAVIEAAETFGLSEPTVYRDLSWYRRVPKEDRETITRLNT